MKLICTKLITFIGLALFLLLFGLSTNSMSQDDCCHFKIGSKQISVEEFLESCDVTGKTARGSPPYFDCQSYILGVADSFKAPSQNIDVNHQICIPKDFETKDLLVVVWDDYRKIKEADYDKMVAHVSAADFIHGSLMKRFGCKK